MLATFFSLYFLWGLVAIYLPGGISEKEEFTIFTKGILMIPILAAAASAFIILLEKLLFSKVKIFYPILLFVLSAYFMIFTWQLRTAGASLNQCADFSCILQTLDGQVPSWQTGETARLSVPDPVVWTTLLLFPILTVMAIILSVFLTRVFNSGIQLQGIEKVCYFLMSILLGLAAVNFSSLLFQSAIGVILKSIGVTFLFIFIRPVLQKNVSSKVMGIITGLIVVAIAFLVFDPAFTIEKHHQSFFLGPANDLYAGKSLLTDIDCQYGILVIYFLNFMLSFVPYSFPGFTLLVTLLYWVQYTAVYFILRHLLKSVWAAVVMVLVIIQTNFFATIGGSSAAAYPSIGPLRFGIPYCLFLLELFAIRRGLADKRKLLIGSFIVAFASLWSFETFFYTAGTFLVILFYESCFLLSRKRQFLRKMAIGIFWPLVFLIIGHGLLAVHIYLRAGEWPHWNYYYDFIFLYSAQEFGSMRIMPWTPWILTIIIPLASLFAIFAFLWVGEKKSRTADFRIIAGLCGLSLAQFTYFLGRSHPNNLYHISVPIMMLAAFWLFGALGDRDRLPQGFKTSFVVCSFFAASFLIVSLMPRTIGKIAGNLENYSSVYARIHEVLTKTPTTPQVVEALELIQEYTKDKSRIGIFLSTDDTAEAMILSHKANVFPVNYPTQTENLLPARMRALNFVPDFKKGDVIFVSRDTSIFQQLLVKNIQDRFHFAILKQTPNGIMAIRLE